MVVSSLVTWLASVWIQSPAEIAARTAPPNPSPVLVAVEERELATKVVSRGTAHYGSPRSLSVAPSVLKDGPRIITRLPNVGSVVDEGDVLVTVAERPAFLLKGTQPAYRDLGPGMSGNDVRQVEKALERLGLNPGAVDGTYDASTADAVGQLYRRNGFAPVVATDALLAEVRTREADLVAGGRASGGIQLPADEIIFVPGTPVRVTKREGRLGEPAKGALLTVTDSVVVIDGLLPVEEAGLVKAGMPVQVDEPALAIKATGKVSRVSAQPGKDGADGFHVSFEVEVADPPPSLVGASVRLTVPVESTKKAQLTVPVSAITVGPDGGSRVQRSLDGKLEFVPVEPGLSADGYVAITAPKNMLAAKDMVVVGLNGKAGG